MTRPDVSVIIAAWKAADLVECAVRSALMTRGVTIEVIVVDDASPDRTFAVLKQLAAHDPRVIIDRLTSNGGPSVARNRAIDLASGKFIAILDADDTIEPDRLSRLVARAERHAADIVVDNMKEVDATGRLLSSGLFVKSPAFSTDRNIDLETWIAFNQPMKAGDCIGYLKPLIRRASLDRFRAIYDPALRNSEDYYLVAELLVQGARMLYLSEPGYRYTRSPASTSHRLNSEHTRAWLDAEARYVRRYGATLTAGQQQALARRSRALRHVDQLIAATEALKSHRFGEFLRLLAADLESSAYTIVSFAKAASSKLRRPAS